MELPYRSSPLTSSPSPSPPLPPSQSAAALTTKRRTLSNTPRCSRVFRLILLFWGMLVVLWTYACWQLLAGVAQVMTAEDDRRYDSTSKQDPTGGAFVHLGKTGGSTLSVLLRNGCASIFAKPCYQVSHETVASRLIHSYYHVMDFGALRQSHHDFYLFSLRDPFDRLISAFCYEHIANRRATNDLKSLNRFQLKVLDNAYQRCFPTLEVFASYFRQGNPFEFNYPYRHNVVDPSSCRDFALAVFHGKVRIFRHLYFNYQQIVGMIPQVQNQTILATRLEHIWDDWKSVNVYLGQAPETIVLPTEDNQKAHLRNIHGLELPVTKDLSQAGREALCLALQHEYDVYFWLVSRARNLQKRDLATSLLRAREHCPSVQLDFKALQ